MQSQSKLTNSSSPRLHAFIFEAVTEAIKTALDEAKAAERETATPAATAPTKPLPWYEASDSISADIAK